MSAPPGHGAALSDPRGTVFAPTVTGLPDGYTFGVTRYADIILREAFPARFAELVDVFSAYRIASADLLTGGGNRTSFVARFDASLRMRGWGKRSISITKVVDDRQIHATRGHEIDMFAERACDDPFPGIAVEMEWNNKDPFFDRDLLNFQALHREGALAVGIIVTRGPELQRLLGPTIRKFGRSTTHWDKLVPRVNLGGGGECPLLLVGIEPGRVTGFGIIREAYQDGRRLSDGDAMAEDR